MAVPDKPMKSPRFETGSKVRVKPGVRVPDFATIPLDGWSGTIRERIWSEEWIEYGIEWDQRTFDALPEAYLEQCQREDLEPEILWLGEEDLEPDNGKRRPKSAPVPVPVPVKPPIANLPPPPRLSENNREDRIRKALGLTHDDPLPAVSFETLRTYQHYLTDHLKFPFNATMGLEELGSYSRRRVSLTVTGLIDVEPDDPFLEDGLICTYHERGLEDVIPLVDLVVGKKNRNSKLVADYAYWIQTRPFLDEDVWVEEKAIGNPDARLPSRRDVTIATVRLGFWGGFLGSAIGASLKTLNGAGLAAMLGGIPLGIIGAVLLGIYGLITEAVNNPRRQLIVGPVFGAFVGAMGGGLFGVIGGLAVVALPWSLLGMLVGMFLVGPFVFRRGARRSVSLRGMLLGICCGLLFAAFRHDVSQATKWAIAGVVISILGLCGPFVIMACLAHLGKPAVPGPNRQVAGVDNVEL